MIVVLVLLSPLRSKKKRANESLPKVLRPIVSFYFVPVVKDVVVGDVMLPFGVESQSSK